LSWEVILSKQAVKDVQYIKQAGLSKNLKALLNVLQGEPFAISP